MEEHHELGCDTSPRLFLLFGKKEGKRLLQEVESLRKTKYGVKDIKGVSGADGKRG